MLDILFNSVYDILIYKNCFYCLIYLIYFISYIAYKKSNIINKIFNVARPRSAAGRAPES